VEPVARWDPGLLQSPTNMFALMKPCSYISSEAISPSTARTAFRIACGHGLTNGRRQHLHSLVITSTPRVRHEVSTMIGARSKPSPAGVPPVSDDEANV